MARTVKDAILDTRSARLRLTANRKHWRSIESGLHIGYRRGPRGGTWLARRNVEGRYPETRIGIADDFTDADGHKVLNFRQAIEEARKWWQFGASRTDAPAGRRTAYTIGRACDDYLAHYVARGGKSEYTVRRVIDVHIRPALSSDDTGKLTTRRIREWHLALAAAPKLLRTKRGAPTRSYREVDAADHDAVRSRRATANRILTVLKAVLNHAWRERLVASDDAWRPVKPFSDVESAIVRYLSADECRRLVNTCPPALRDLVRGALLTGARYGELIRLKARDVNLETGTIAIRQSKGGSARHIVLTAEGSELFSRLISGRPPDQMVFYRDDGEPWKPSQPTRPLVHASRRIGIEPPVTFHILRHTHASALAMAGVPMGVIAAQLGHADTRITSKHYAHFAPSYIAETIRAHFPELGINADGAVVRTAARRA